MISHIFVILMILINSVLTYKVTNGDFVRKFLYSLNAFVLSVVVLLIIGFIFYGMSETQEHGGIILNMGSVIIWYSCIYSGILLYVIKRARKKSPEVL